MAAIVILGVRTYFFQNFEIPTNSMWPTYSGMTAEPFPPGTGGAGPARPAPPARCVRRRARGNRRSCFRRGVGRHLSSGQLARTLVRGRTWLVFPAKQAFSH